MEMALTVERLRTLILSWLLGDTAEPGLLSKEYPAQKKKCTPIADLFYKCAMIFRQV